MGPTGNLSCCSPQSVCPDATLAALSLSVLLLSELCLLCWCLPSTVPPQKCLQEESQQGGARCRSHTAEGRGWPGGSQGALPAKPGSAALGPVSAQHRSAGSKGPCAPLFPQATVTASLGQSSYPSLDGDSDFLDWQKKKSHDCGTVRSG